MTGKPELTPGQPPAQAIDFSSTNRLEAFSDGVMAVLITILVLDLRVPQSADLAALKPLIPTFIAYLLSFRVVGTFWNNHHHLFKAARGVTARVMWNNLTFLFCLSLLPFATSWLGSNYTAPWPTALYALVALACGGSYNRLQSAVLATRPADEVASTSFRTDLKGKISLACYFSAIPLAFVSHWLSDALFVAVAVLWYIPDRRVGELGLGEEEGNG